MTSRFRYAGLLLAAVGLAACDESTGPQGRASSIALRVYLDADTTASFSAGDSALAGVVVSLHDNVTGAARTATTDAQGLAHFEEVTAGSYTAALDAAVTPPAGAVLATAGSLTIRAPFLGAEIEDEFRFAYYPASISGVVYRDNDGDGAYDEGTDTPGPGFGVRLYRGSAATGETVAQTVSSSTGAYRFDALLPGTYTLEFHSPIATAQLPQPTMTVELVGAQPQQMATRFTGVLLVSVAQARAADSTSTVVVEGVVTASQGTFGGTTAYMQDRTAGVMLFRLDSALGLEVGDSIRVMGMRSAFRQQIQIDSAKATVLGTGSVPAPRALTGAQLLSRQYEGELARVAGVVVDTVETTSATATTYNLRVTDAAGTQFIIRVAGFGVGIAPSTWVKGTRYNVVGILASFNGTAQLQPRSAADVERIVVQIPPVSVAAARALPKGTPARVVGVVTAGSAAFNGTFYIQDATGGVMAYRGSNVALGDSVLLTGVVDDFNQEIQIEKEPADSSLVVTRLGTGTLPAARTVTGAEFLARTYEGQLARLNALTVTSVGTPTSSGAFTVTATTGTGETVQIRVLHGNTGLTVGNFQSGVSYSVVGVLGSYNGTPQLKPRSTADVTPAS